MTVQPYSIVFETPIAKMGIRSSGNSVSEIAWLPDHASLLKSRAKFINQVRSHILYYLDTGRPLPRVPMNLTGTEFQLAVWKSLQNIKVGSVMTYGQLAAKMNTSSRAIGQACRTNPVVLFIPCHRIVSVSGIGGYMGKQNRINIKNWLLEHEKAHV